MRLHLTRAHRRFLGLTGPLEPGDGHGLPLTRVILSVQAQVLFNQVLDATGTHRSGPLFGRIEDGVARIQYAALGGYWPQGMEGDGGLFGMTGEYVLGWLDALRMEDSGIDWVGQWMTFPDARAALPEAELPWLERASRVGLVDQHHALLFAGLRRYELEVHAYSYFPGDGETRLEVDEGE